MSDTFVVPSLKCCICWTCSEDVIRSRYYYCLTYFNLLSVMSTFDELTTNPRIQLFKSTTGLDWAQGKEVHK